MGAFRKIEHQKSLERSPKRGYGYRPKEQMEKFTTGFLVSNDYGQIPQLRGKARGYPVPRTAEKFNPRRKMGRKRSSHQYHPATAEVAPQMEQEIEE